MTQLKEFLLSKIERKENGCWEWKGDRRNGYGVLRISEIRLSAARLFYELYVSDVPVGLWILHKCDNPPCVNPEHLYPGSHGDNMRDMVERWRCGKLDRELVLELRENRDRLTVSQLAKRHALRVGQVFSVMREKSWGHLAGKPNYVKVIRMAYPYVRRRPDDLDGRIQKKIRRSSTGCWIWLGTYRPDSGSRIFFKGKDQSVNRFLFEKSRGPLKKRMLKRCKIERCVNPEHHKLSWER